jgi:DnaJ-domain-containing protein 1
MEQSPDDQAFRPATGRSFPGGQVRLPRLNAEDRAGEPQIDVVGTAFLGGGTTTITDEPEPAGFTGYFTYESLFDEPDVNDPDSEGEDPYAVLRVAPTDDWTTIVAAHRSLVKEFHPDRFVDHPAEVVAQADIEIKRINLAYGLLRKQRASQGSERRSGDDRRSS